MRIILGSYTILMAIWIVFSYLFVDVNIKDLEFLFTGVFGNQRLLVSMMFFLLLSSNFVFYIYILAKKSQDFLLTKKLIIISLLLLLAYPAIFSFDIFNYILTAKVAFFYKENPYIVMPIEIPNEPMLAFAHAPNKIALYGPFWILLTVIPLILGLGNLLITIFTFKFLALIFYLISVFLIYKFTKSQFASTFFALNPLVVLETFMSGHNDIVMMGLALIALSYSLRKKYILTVIFLVLSILIKYATLFLIPLFVYIFIINYKKEKVNIEKIGYIGFVSMLLIFFLSPLRAEIYPWYSIWFLSFSALCIKKRWVTLFSIAISYGLMLRYLPFMYLGTYFGIVPRLNTFLMFLPLVIVGFYFIFVKWLKKHFQ